MHEEDSAAAVEFGYSVQYSMIQYLLPHSPCSFLYTVLYSYTFFRRPHCCAFCTVRSCAFYQQSTVRCCITFGAGCNSVQGDCTQYTKVLRRDVTLILCSTRAATVQNTLKFTVPFNARQSTVYSKGMESLYTIFFSIRPYFLNCLWETLLQVRMCSVSSCWAGLVVDI